MEFDPGFAIHMEEETLTFSYGDGAFGPICEKRHLNDIRSSLADADADGPDVLYSIAMDVGMEKDREAIVQCNLLYGAVAYAKGRIGKEPVRSQGHIHAISPSCNASTCEVYEIWSGEAYIYMQQYGGDDAGNCYAVHAKAGDVVIVPPGWVHATVNANIHENMSFGAWCVRDYGFAYQEVREHNGIAFFPLADEAGNITWEMNPSYSQGNLTICEAKEYPQFGIEKGKPIYTQFQENPDKFLFVAHPEIKKKEWEELV